jgi:hypothetical protein
MFRALRLDKMIYQALGIHAAPPAAGAMGRGARAAHDPPKRDAEIRERAERLVNATRSRSGTRAGESVIGGGATPEQSIPTWLIAIECATKKNAAARQRSAGDRARRRKAAAAGSANGPAGRRTELAAALQALS